MDLEHPDISSIRKTGYTKENHPDEQVKEVQPMKYGCDLTINELLDMGADIDVWFFDFNTSKKESRRIIEQFEDVSDVFEEEICGDKSHRVKADRIEVISHYEEEK